MSAFNADALMASPSWKSMARTVLLSRRVLNSPFGSFSWAPFGNVSLYELPNVVFAEEHLNRDSRDRT